jgi:peptidyl-prolyl cis-trans isomerase D
MLHLMRKHAGSWLIKVVLGVVVIVFILWGSSAYRARQGTRVAVVNGETVGLDEYRQTYERLTEQYRRQFGNTLDPEVLEKLDLKRQAMDQLIGRRLLLHKAKSLDLAVTDQEIIGAVQNMAAFQQDGRFDARIYQRVLAANRLTPEIFEEGLREDLLVEKVRQLVIASAKVSQAEVLETYQWREGLVNMDYVLFEPSAQKEIALTPEEVASYYAQHKADYEIPPQVKIGYVAFPFKELQAGVSISDEEIEEYFQDNKETFATPKKVHARHILFKVEQGASQEGRDMARAMALKVMNEAKAGANFADLAKKYSGDPGTKDKGGDLGFFTEDRMVEPFSAAAFAMKPGDISEPVETIFGWHIIKVEAVQEAKEPALAEVKETIRTKLAEDRARSVAYDQAESLYDAAYGARLADTAKARGMEIHETEFFSRNDPFKGIPQAEKLAQVAFDLSDEEVSEPVELPDGYYVLQVIERKDAAIAELEVVEKKVREDLTKSRQDELAKKDADAFLGKVKDGRDMEQEAKAVGLEMRSTDYFKRFGSIPGIGFERELTDTVFSLRPSRPLPEQVVKGKKGYYVIRFKDRKEADPKAFEAKKSEIEEGLLAQKQQNLLDEWLSQLRRDGDVLIEKEFLD